MTDARPSARAGPVGASPAGAPAAPSGPRPIRQGDAPAIARLAARAFAPTEAAFVRSTGEGFVIEAADGLAAAVLLRVIPLPGGRRVGFVAWLMTDPDHRGGGLASRLAGLGVARLAELGCDRVLTEIEGHNTGSEGVFRGLGFRPVGLRRQIAAFGPAGTALLHVRTSHAFSPGHRFWLKDAAAVAPSEAGERLAAWSLNGIFALLALGLGGGLLGGGRGVPAATEAIACLAAVAVVLGSREAAMRAVARARGLPVEFRAWGMSGVGITAAIALGFGQLFPLPGSVYPADPGWRYRAALPALGAAALAGAASVAALVAAALWITASVPATAAGAFAAAVLFVGKPLLLFDTLAAIPPFHAFNARRIHDLNRGLWAMAAAVGLGLFLL